MNSFLILFLIGFLGLLLSRKVLIKRQLIRYSIILLCLLTSIAFFIGLNVMSIELVIFIILHFVIIMGIFLLMLSKAKFYKLLYNNLIVYTILNYNMASFVRSVKYYLPLLLILFLFLNILEFNFDLTILGYLGHNGISGLEYSDFTHPIDYCVAFSTEEVSHWSSDTSSESGSEISFHRNGHYIHQYGTDGSNSDCALSRTTTSSSTNSVTSTNSSNVSNRVTNVTKLSNSSSMPQGFKPTSFNGSTVVNMTTSVSMPNIPK